ncbi:MULTISPECIES: glucose 1-dehydrogenase [Pseudomonadota]|uniref:SDR family NAD(P)-dependent oxidoreductase n=1 Tax=Pseudomonadota TaxID=1224 RepID=UPI001F5CEB02|nr:MULTISPECIES: glucose 1-dehydrogenase [Pseudomonadota]MCI3204051.1 3-alpha-hydroxysteroid dehydrogenase [Pandoraea sp. LA3]MDN4582077.1 3-alpha-hydroxysteroid dehydrogenase [Pandoraea capi]UPG95893.1 glucose 1-dehydrogenase [Luteibacter aegosomatissinici]
MTSIQGKTIIVTGAANGIGRAEADLLAQSGANVVFTDLDEVNGTSAVEAFSGHAIFVRHDVSSALDWERVIATTIERFGRLDGLINNAGIYRPGSLEETTEEIFDRQVAINQKGTFLGMKYAAAEMKKVGGGSIVNTSSICGIRGIRGCIAYNGTKWAIRGLTKTAAAELGEYGIRVNAILPGFIDTNILAANPPEMNQQAAKDAVLNRLGSPGDIASLAQYLISDESSFVTGADFLADGGYTL